MQALVQHATTKSGSWVFVAWLYSANRFQKRSANSITGGTEQDQNNTAALFYLAGLAYLACCQLWRASCNKVGHLLTDRWTQ